MADVGRNDYTIGGNVVPFNKAVDSAIAKLGQFFDNMASLSDEIDKFADRAGQKFDTVATKMAAAGANIGDGARDASTGFGQFNSAILKTLQGIDSTLKAISGLGTQVEDLADKIGGGAEVMAEVRAALDKIASAADAPKGKIADLIQVVQKFGDVSADDLSVEQIEELAQAFNSLSPEELATFPPVVQKLAEQIRVLFGSLTEGQVAADIADQLKAVLVGVGTSARAAKPALDDTSESVADTAKSAKEAAIAVSKFSLFLRATATLTGEAGQSLKGVTDAFEKFRTATNTKEQIESFKAFAQQLASLPIEKLEKLPPEFQELAIQVRSLAQNQDEIAGISKSIVDLGSNKEEISGLTDAFEKFAKATTAEEQKVALDAVNVELEKLGKTAGGIKELPEPLQKIARSIKGVADQGVPLANLAKTTESYGKVQNRVTNDMVALSAKTLKQKADQSALDEQYKLGQAGGVLGYGNRLKILTDQLENARGATEKVRIVTTTLIDVFKDISEATRDLSQFFTSSIKQSDDFAERFVKLKSAMESAGVVTPKLQDGFQEFLNTLERVTTFTDEELATAGAVIFQNLGEVAIGAATKAGQLGESIAKLTPEAKAATAQFQLLAAAGVTVGNKSANLAQAAEAVSKAVSGDISLLARLVPTIKNTPELLADTGKALQFVADRAKAFPSKTPIQTFAQELSNTSKNVGQALAVLRDAAIKVLTPVIVIFGQLAKTPVGAVAIQIAFLATTLLGGTIAALTFVKTLTNTIKASQFLADITKSLVNAKKALVSITSVENLVQGTSTKLKVADAAGNLILTGTTNTLAASISRAAAAATAFAVATFEFTVVAAIVVGAVVALVFVVDKLIGAWKRLSGAQEKTRTETSALGRALPNTFGAIERGYKGMLEASQKQLFANAEMDASFKSTLENTVDATDALKKSLEDVGKVVPLTNLPGAVDLAMRLAVGKTKEGLGEIEKLVNRLIPPPPAIIKPPVVQAPSVTPTAISFVDEQKQAIATLDSVYKGTLSDFASFAKTIVETTIRAAADVVEPIGAIVKNGIDKIIDDAMAKIKTFQGEAAKFGFKVFEQVVGVGITQFEGASATPMPATQPGKTDAQKNAEVANKLLEQAGITEERRARLRAQIIKGITDAALRGVREGIDQTLIATSGLTIELRTAATAAEDLGGQKFGAFLGAQAKALANDALTTETRQKAAQILSGQVGVLDNLVNLGKIDLLTARQRLTEHLATLKTNKNLANQVNEIAAVERGIAQNDRQRADNAAARVALGERDLSTQLATLDALIKLRQEREKAGASEAEVLGLRQQELTDERTLLQNASDLLAIGDPQIENARKIEEAVRARIAGTTLEVELRRDLIQLEEGAIGAIQRRNAIGKDTTDNTIEQLAAEAEIARRKGFLLDVEEKLADAVLTTANRVIDVKGNTAAAREETERALVKALKMKDTFGFLPESVKKLETALVGVFQKENEIALAAIDGEEPVTKTLAAAQARISAEADTLDSVHATADAYNELAELGQHIRDAAFERLVFETKSTDKANERLAILDEELHRLKERAERAPERVITPRERRRSDAGISLNQALEEAQDPFAGFFDKIGTEFLGFSDRLADGLASELMRAFSETGSFAKAQFGKIFRQIGISFGQLVIQKILSEIAGLIASAAVKLFISIFSGGPAIGGFGGFFGALFGGATPGKIGQHGFSGVVNRPTRFLAGEAGAERIDITPAGQVVPLAEEIGSGVFSAIASRLSGLIDNASTAVGFGGLQPALAGSHVTIIVKEPSPLTQVQFVDDVVAKRMDQRTKDLRKGLPRPIKNPTVRR